MARKDLKKIITDAENVEPIADFYGIKITTYEDGAKLRKADAIDDEEPSISNRLMNPDGTVARSAIKYASVNPKKMFDNRVRRIERDGAQILQIVVDKRAIREQNTGSIYLKTIPVYEIARKGKELTVCGITNVVDTEFMSEFSGKINQEGMCKILPLIDNYGVDLTSEELGI